MERITGSKMQKPAKSNEPMLSPSRGRQLGGETTRASSNSKIVCVILVIIVALTIDE